MGKRTGKLPATRCFTSNAVKTALIYSDQAAIVFDSNTISTTKWFNTIDNTPPDSRVSQLPTIETRTYLINPLEPVCSVSGAISGLGLISHVS